MKDEFQKNQVAELPSLPDIISEYHQKVMDLENVEVMFKEAVTRVEMASTVQGTFVDSIWYRSSPSFDVNSAKKNLLLSAWRCVYKGLPVTVTAKDKERFERELKTPPELTLENIRAMFGDYMMDPRGHILRGIAEVFSDLDPAYKSHSKVKIGVKGLPKRICIQNCGDWGSNGYNKLRDVINALRAYRGEKQLVQGELEDQIAIKTGKIRGWEKDGRYSYNSRVMHENRYFKSGKSYIKTGEFDPAAWARIIEKDTGLRFKKYQNGNLWVYFNDETCTDINKALAEYYGDVLADSPEERKSQAGKARSTAVSADLAYYPTPKEAVARVLNQVTILKGMRVLEPSCGCGRFIEAMYERQPEAIIHGIEYDHGRVALCKAKGFAVMQANFLEMTPTGDYDLIVMNPPFAGEHWKKHLEQAIRFLKPMGSLIAILPATAQVDGHLNAMFKDRKDVWRRGGWKQDGWSDLPVGSFRESGTNVATGYFALRREY